MSGKPAIVVHSAGVHTAASWDQLAESLLTSQVPFEAAYGRSLWDHLAANPSQETTFTKAMATSVSLLNEPLQVDAEARQWHAGLESQIPGLGRYGQQSISLSINVNAAREKLQLGNSACLPHAICWADTYSMLQGVSHLQIVP